MISLTKFDLLNTLRITIVVQSLISVWFLVAPDTIRQVFIDAKMANDRPLYEKLDQVIVPILHLQAVLCLLLWWPKKAIALGYLFCAVFILILGAVAGPSVLSAVDGTFSSLQGLASGAMLLLLYQGGFLRILGGKLNEQNVAS
jgi:hypothetical protein